ncbi:MAG: Hsp20/alpha crystallin family protein [Chlorobium sp.]|jgi:HSP20 family protein|nr:MAG: Hsp20/alpha crystallin family protein [Chlorobium sp.]
MKNEKDSNGPGESEFDFLGFGSLFKGIEKLVDLASKLEQTGAINREGEMNLDHLKKGMKGVYGFTIKSAVGGGSPKVETFGNIVKTPQGPKVNEEREPITDVFDESDEIVIIAEMPGINEEDIVVSLNDDIVDISTNNSKKNYRKELLLPFKPNNTIIQQKYTNGILEIRIKK